MGQESPSSESLRNAVDRVGGQSALSRLLGVSQQSVSKWLLRGKPLPGEHVIKVEKELKRLGFEGPDRFDLRPDLYPRESGDDHAAPIALERAR